MIRLVIYTTILRISYNCISVCLFAYSFWLHLLSYSSIFVKYAGILGVDVVTAGAGVSALHWGIPGPAFSESYKGMEVDEGGEAAKSLSR